MPQPSRRPRRFALLALAILLGACTPKGPQRKAEKRPTGAEVAAQAGTAAKKTDRQKLVLYSSSMKKAELEPSPPEKAEAAKKEAKPKSPATPPKVEVGVDSQGHYTLAGQNYASVDKFVAALAKVHAQRATASVELNVAPKATQKVVTEAIAAARRAGFTRLVLNTQTAPPAQSAPAPKSAPAKQPDAAPQKP